MPSLSDAAGKRPLDPPDPARDAPGSGRYAQPLKIEERFGVPEGVGYFFRIEAASGRSFAVWASSEEIAETAVERIDRATIASGREAFRIAAVPVRLAEVSEDDFDIAKVREIKS